jgi:hypothetical protein
LRPGPPDTRAKPGSQRLAKASSDAGGRVVIEVASVAIASSSVTARTLRNGASL